MEHSPQSEATRLLLDLSSGNDNAAEALFPLIYEDLRGIASADLLREKGGHTLQATALVHEAYLRLVDVGANSIESRAHFFRLAARAMRRLLVDHARGKAAAKRGANPVFQTQSSLNNVSVWTQDDIIELDDALSTLASHDDRKARLVELRFFGGLSIEEAASALEIGHSTAERDWKFAKAWLASQLGRQG